MEIASKLNLLRDDGLLLLGDLYANQHLLREAVEIYAQLADRVPEIGTGRLVVIARSLIQANDLDGAGAILERVDALDAAGQPEFMRLRASHFMARENWQKARQVLDDLLRLEPLDGDALLLLAACESRLGNSARAEFLLEQAIQVPEFAFRANVELANLALRQRRYGMGLTHLQKALNIERSSALLEHIERIKPLATTHENTPHGQ
jgi:tetratricopeptide (TPR) repeat protein